MQTLGFHAIACLYWELAEGPKGVLRKGVQSNGGFRSRSVNAWEGRTGFRPMLESPTLARQEALGCIENHPGAMCVTAVCIAATGLHGVDHNLVKLNYPNIDLSGVTFTSANLMFSLTCPPPRNRRASSPGCPWSASEASRLASGMCGRPFRSQIKVLV